MVTAAPASGATGAPGAPGDASAQGAADGPTWWQAILRRGAAGDAPGDRGDARPPEGRHGGQPDGAPQQQQPLLDRILGAEAARAVGAVAAAVAASVGRETNKEIADAVGGAIRDSLLAPAFDKVVTDAAPYLWVAAALAAVLALVGVCQIVLMTALLCRHPR